MAYFFNQVCPVNYTCFTNIVYSANKVFDKNVEFVNKECLKNNVFLPKIPGK